MINVQNTVPSRNIKPVAARRGGQASLPPFGFASFTAPTTPSVQPARRGDDQPRRLGGLTYGQRAARIRAMVTITAVAARKGQTALAAQVPPVVLARTQRIADEFDGYGLGGGPTAAMQRAAADSARRDARDWNTMAELAATPEWDHAGCDRIEAAIN